MLKIKTVIISSVLLLSIVGAKQKASQLNISQGAIPVLPSNSINHEQQVSKLILECINLMGQDPEFVYIHDVPKNLPHPQTWNLQKCLKYAVPIEDRDMRNRFKRDLSDPEQKKAYDLSKQIEEVYEKIYLHIKADRQLVTKLPVEQPLRFKREFDEKTGLTQYLSKLNKQGQLSPSNILQYQTEFFGSEAEMKKEEEKFLLDKLKALNIGEF